MASLNFIDGIFALVIAASALLACSRGAVREGLAIIGWIAAAIASFAYAPAIKPVIERLPVAGDFVVGSCEFAMIAAFTAVFAVTLLAASILAPVLAAMVRSTSLSGADKFLGFLFGAARGAILVAIVYFIYSAVFASQGYESVDSSWTAGFLDGLAAQIDGGYSEAVLNWVKVKYEELVGACPGEIPAADLSGDG